MHKLIKQIEEYSTYKDNWNGDDSFAPTFNNIQSSLNLLTFLPDNMPIPTPMLFNDGRVGFYWDNDIYYIDIEVENNNTFSIFARERLLQLELFDDNVFIAEKSVYDILTNYMKELKIS